jgi:hypothetical protein
VLCCAGRADLSACAVICLFERLRCSLFRDMDGGHPLAPVRRTPQDQQLADHLNWRAAQGRAQPFHDADTLRPVITEDPDLDQLMMIQCPISFGHHGWCEAGIADHDHWIEMVSRSAQLPAFGRSQLQGTRGRRGLVDVCWIVIIARRGKVVLHRHGSSRACGSAGRAMLQPR